MEVVPSVIFSWDSHEFGKDVSASEFMRELSYRTCCIPVVRLICLCKRVETYHVPARQCFVMLERLEFASQSAGLSSSEGRQQSVHSQEKPFDIGLHHMC